MLGGERVPVLPGNLLGAELADPRDRIALTVATQPLEKRTRALAMSSCGLATAAPTASTLSIGLSTSARIRSRSWIIRSRITETSVPRCLNGAIRVASM